MVVSNTSNILVILEVASSNLACLPFDISAANYFYVFIVLSKLYLSISWLGKIHTKFGANPSLLFKRKQSENCDFFFKVLIPRLSQTPGGK